MALKDQIIRLILTAQRISAKPFITIEELTRQISFSLESMRIKKYCGRWYAVGKELGGSIKIFGLDRIENLKSTRI